MLQEISRRYEVNLKGVHTIGDSLRDLQSGFVVGCIPHLVLTGKGRKRRKKAGCHRAHKFILTWQPWLIICLRQIRLISKLTLILRSDSAVSRNERKSHVSRYSFYPLFYFHVADDCYHGDLVANQHAVRVSAV
jgi:hypothetical protein